ncbi:hypothetical protein [Segatella paludivivens]|uniref:hypothetical protein n=1 Tax=Segatella paludivivens TaxID=185294 RepID=UPI00036EEF8D|nr:hypothetical protein [Segatella paludivivens]
MRTKPAILAFFALATIAMQGLLTSCSGDETLSTEKQEGLQTLKINLNTVTRAAVYSDPAAINPNPEDKINRVTIGIFDKNTGNAVKTIQDAVNPAAPEITTSQLAADDHILVAVNAPAGTFTGVLSESDFEKRTLAIDDALAGGNASATTVANANIPMFGVGSIVQIGTTPAYKADVDVYHMVAKVTLQSLYVDFDATGAYKDATFTPTEVFMYNVPDKLDFYPAKTTTSYIYNYLTTSTPVYYNGEAGDAAVKNYLGTGTTLTPFVPANTPLKGLKTGSTSSWGTVGSKILFLYTMPNTSSKPTQLVIKGIFRPVGTDDGKATVYYPVNINYNSTDGSAAEGATPKQVYPNKNYIVDVTIKGKGADLPSASLDPETATANITVKSFVDASQTNVFN